jgi:hypothetical protein
MAGTITNQLQLGESAVSDQLRDFRGAFAALNEVAAGARGIQPR